MSGLEVRLDPAALRPFAELAANAAKRAPREIAAAVNAVGDKAKSRMIPVLAKQTGLKVSIMRRALKATRAGPGALAYRIRAKGGNVHLKYFGARETLSGVTAAPWGHRQLYPHSFIKGGRFPSRVTLGMGGQVFVRTGPHRLPIADLRSGLFIPAEMVAGETAAAFRATAAAELPQRLSAALQRLLGR